MKTRFLMVLTQCLLVLQLDLLISASHIQTDLRSARRTQKKHRATEGGCQSTKGLKVDKM